MKYSALILAVFVGCSVLGLSQATTGRDSGQKQNFCQGCKSILSFARTLNSTERKDDFKEAFKSFCEIYYPNSTDYQEGPCELFLSAFYYLLDHMDPIHHCDQIGACGKINAGSLNNLLLGNPVDDNMPPRATNLVCEFCESSFRRLQDFLSDPKVIDDAESKMEELCSYMSVVGQDKECLSLLRNYLNQAVDFIKGTSGATYCKAIHLCYAGRLPAMTRLLPEPSLTVYRGFGLETETVIGERPVDRNPMDCKRAPNCALCKTVVKELFHFIKNNRTEEKIEEALDRVCVLVYRGNQDKLEQCESMVKAYSKEIVQMIIDETDPELICMMLEQCACEPAASIDLSQFISKLDPTIPVGSARTCLECKFFIDYLKSTVENPHTQNFLRYWLLDHLCANLGEKDLQSSCTEMVNKYSAAFFQAIAQQLDSGDVCHELGACKHPKKTLVFNAFGEEEDTLSKIITLPEQTLSRRRPVKTANPICEQCIDIVTKLDNYLSTHPIDQDVSVLIDNVCDKLPSETAKSECTLLVKTFGSEITEAIASMENPRQLCSKIMLC